jgi:isopenicillin N synthase-like dioxygenase
MTEATTFTPALAAGADDVPVLDLAPLLAGGDISELAREIRRACEGMAFFYVRNHGVPETVIDAAFDASRRFFAEPLESRMKVHKDRFHRGYLPLGTTRYPGKAADLKDSFDIGVDLALDHPDVVAGLPLHGPNQWPELDGFRAPVEAYFQAVRDCGLRLLGLFARSLEVEDDFFARHYDSPTILMRMLHYPPQSEAKEEGSIGAFPHSDYGVMTLLAQDPSGGLELQKPDGSWIGAPYIPGTFVVNIGDLMARWTNDVYRSNQHRVVNRLGSERYSIPFFFNPNHFAPVECIPSCAGPDRPRLYPTVAAGEYVANKIRTNQGFRDPETPA